MRTVLLYVLIPLFVAVLIFYFWGQAGSMKHGEMHQLESYPVPGAASGDTISIMTYNLGYLSGMTNNLPVKPPYELFEDNLGRAKEMLSKFDPDIVGFQEIDYHSARSYYMNQADSLRLDYAAVVKSVNWDKNYVPFPYWPPTVHFGKMLSGQALFSKFPVVESERMVLSPPAMAPFYYKAFYLDRLIQVVKLSIKDQEVVVLNVHLEAFDEQTREQQAGEVLKVVDQFARTQPVLLIGDFNARPPFASEKLSDEKTMDLFLNHPLLSPAIDRDRYLRAEREHFTFDTDSPYEKLDYIFYTHDYISPLSAATIAEAGQISDHLPVMFTFILEQN